MRKVVILAVAALAAPQAIAQQIVASLNASGALTCSTSAGHWAYVNGGRSGWHWYDYTDQQTQGKGTIPLNGNGSAGAVGTYYQPNYSITAYGSTTFSNGATSAVFNASLEDDTVFTPTLGQNQNASVSAASTQSNWFKINSSCKVTISVTGPAIAHMDDSSGTVIWSSTYGSFSGGLPAGTYFVEIVFNDGASKDTHLGTTKNWGTNKLTAGMQITWQPGGGD